MLKPTKVFVKFINVCRNCGKETPAMISMEAFTSAAERAEVMKERQDKIDKEEPPIKRKRMLIQNHFLCHGDLFSLTANDSEVYEALVLVDQTGGSARIEMYHRLGNSELFRICDMTDENVWHIPSPKGSA